MMASATCLEETATKGTAFQMTLNYDGPTNRITTPGHAYDANGNLTAMPGVTLTYDADNHLNSASQTGGATVHCAYVENDPINFNDPNGLNKELLPGPMPQGDPNAPDGPSKPPPADTTVNGVWWRAQEDGIL